jgi:hypothetical protein
MLAPEFALLLHWVTELSSESVKSLRAKPTANGRALLARLALASRITESADPKARKMNPDMLGFADEYKCLVAIPNRLDGRLAMRDGSGGSLEVEDFEA